MKFKKQNTQLTKLSTAYNQNNYNALKIKCLALVAGDRYGDIIHTEFFFNNIKILETDS